MPQDGLSNVLTRDAMAAAANKLNSKLLRALTADLSFGNLKKNSLSNQALAIDCCETV